MFCGHCGQHNPDTNTQCASCGQEIKLALNPPATAPAAATAPAPAPDSRPMFANLERYSVPEGVGGWLLLFWIGTTILTPIALIAEAVRNADNLMVISIDVGVTALALATGIALAVRSRHALALVRAYFITLLVIAGLSMIGGVMGDTVAVEGSSRTVGGNAIFQGVRTAITVAIWWTYFKKSARVEATYGRNL